jgi:CheY-like chemotaxis protein
MVKILVVEDTPDVADMLVMLLKYDGHEAAVAYSGADGLDALKAEQFHVVISDIGMPHMDGYEFARAMRLVPGYADVPLVAMSGHDREVDKEEARQAGFDQHMAKPVDVEKLTDLVNDLIERGDIQRNASRTDIPLRARWSFCGKSMQGHGR